MMNNKYLVSICIPTYNRSYYLEETIKSIISQQPFLDGIVEVVISDNASTDDTETVGKKYSEKYNNIKYYRNDKNIVDRNFPLALSRATGVLRKLNNDTFVLNPTALQELCDLANKYIIEKPNIFLSNGVISNTNEDRFDFHDFLIKSSFYITWIGSFTIWDKECVNINDDLSGCDLRLWQVKKFYELAHKNDDVIIYNNIIGDTIPMPQKDISYGLHKVFYNNYLSLVSLYKDIVISDEEFNLLKKDLLYHFFTNWILMWELNSKQYSYSKTENLKEVVFNEYKNEPYWKEYSRLYNKRLFKLKIKKLLKHNMKWIVKKDG